MRVLIAPDKFAGTLSATDAAEAMAAGWQSVDTGGTVTVVPLSDGGPGLLDVVEHALGGERVPVVTSDPLDRPLPAEVLVTDDAVFIESAQAVGLDLVAVAERDAERATSAGLAPLLREALRHSGTGSRGTASRGTGSRGTGSAGSGTGRRIVVGLGGSATTDGGRGAIEALGADEIEALRARELVALCDVDNPLLGPNGAAATFGPQKGADGSAVQRLDARLGEWAREIGLPADAPGAGAAGGLGAALFWLGATRSAGADEVAAMAGLADRLAEVDLVVTGEGSFDFTSLRGKLVAGVAQLALAEAVPCIVLAGQVSVGRREMLASGVNAAYALVDEPGGLERALGDPAGALVDLAARVAREWART